MGPVDYYRAVKPREYFLDLVDVVHPAQLLHYVPGRWKHALEFGLYPGQVARYGGLVYPKLDLQIFLRPVGSQPSQVQKEGLFRGKQAPAAWIGGSLVVKRPQLRILVLNDALSEVGRNKLELPNGDPRPCPKVPIIADGGIQRLPLVACCRLLVAFVSGSVWIRRPQRVF